MNGPRMLPRDYVQGGRTMTVEISGRDRFCFFKRPMVPSMTTADGGTQTAAAPLALAVHRPTIQRALPSRPQLFNPPSTAPARAGAATGSLVTAKPRTLEQLAHQAVVAVAKPRQLATGPPPATRDAECQTMYRENECQTDPYTPDYFIEEGQQPEVLAILELRWGEGLPAGKGEVEMIDRVRRRKDVEANLPQGNDNGSMQTRLMQLETLEKAEWEERETHIRNLQAQRLERIDHALTLRETKREQESKDRVEIVKQQKLSLVESQLQKLQERRQTVMRKLTAKHANPCEEKKSRDIIEAHATFGGRASQVQTAALVEKVSAANYDVRPTLLSFVEGIAELEKSKAPQLATVPEEKFIAPHDVAIQSLPTRYQKRQAQQVIDHLEYADQVIEASKTVKGQQSSIQDLYRATPRLQRPDTPTLTLAGDDEEEHDEAVLLLQRLLRGRAMQNKFFEGKERCRGLINELQEAQTAKSSEHLWLDEREAEAFAERQETAIGHVVDAAQGDIVYETLDYLFKELLRQQEAAKVTRLMNRAEATRRDREKAENERRAAEELLKNKEAAQYDALLAKVDAAAESFLEQTLHHSAESIAAEQAFHMQLSAPRAAAVLTEDADREELVCSLLDQFVVPFVCTNLRDSEHQRRLSIAQSALEAGRKLVAR